MNLRRQYRSVSRLASTPALAATAGFASTPLAAAFYDEAMSNAATPLQGLVVLDFTHALLVAPVR